MKIEYKNVFATVLIAIAVNGCKPSSGGDESAVLALALAQNGASCIGAPTITKGGATLSGGAKTGYNFYYYVGGGTTDTVNFTSTPSGVSGAYISIGKTQTMIDSSSAANPSKYDAYAQLAPYSNASVTTNAANFRCFLVSVPSGGISYTLQVQ